MDRVIDSSKKKKRRVVYYVLALSALAVLIVSVTLFKGKKVVAIADRLTISEVEYGSFQEYIPLNGIIQPIKTIYIDAIEGGRVEEIFVEDGKAIESGQAIMRLSNQQFQMDAINREAQLLDQQNNLLTSRLQMDQQAAQLKEQLNETDYNLKESERELNLNEKLYEDSAISRIEYEKSKEKFAYLKKSKTLLIQKIRNDSLFRLNQIGRVESSLSLIDDNIQFLDQTVNNLFIKAPIGGQLSQLQVELGQTVGSGARIGQVDDVSDFKIRASVPEHYITRVSQDLRATFTLNGQQYNLLVNKVYPEVISGLFEIDLVFESEKPTTIRRGQTLQIRLTLGAESQAMKIPRGAFFQKTSGNYVFVITNDNKAEKRTVKLGRQNADYYEVLEGLKTGEKIITSSYDNFGDATELVIQSK
ncbi:MAG: efflux RND transporter periplasmic adaptor subunit [Flavobacteriales bacterium]